MTRMAAGFREEAVEMAVSRSRIVLQVPGLGRMTSNRGINPFSWPSNNAFVLGFLLGALTTGLVWWLG